MSRNIYGERKAVNGAQNLQSFRIFRYYAMPAMPEIRTLDLHVQRKTGMQGLCRRT